jgi:hypothetical protein
MDFLYLNKKHHGFDWLDLVYYVRIAGSERINLTGQTSDTTHQPGDFSSVCPEQWCAPRNADQSALSLSHLDHGADKLVYS